MTSLASTLEHANQALFLVINAPAHPDTFMIGLATVFAQYAIWLLPALGLLAGWRGTRQVRRVWILATVAAVIGLLVNLAIGQVWPHPRPFMIGVGFTHIAHAPDASFPSDHLTVLWSAAFALLWNPMGRRAGAMLALLGLPMAWGRIYLGVHFPFDMAGSLLVGMSAAWAAYGVAALYMPSAEAALDHVRGALMMDSRHRPKR